MFLLILSNLILGESKTVWENEIADISVKLWNLLTNSVQLITRSYVILFTILHMHAAI